MPLTTLRRQLCKVAGHLVNKHHYGLQVLAPTELLYYCAQPLDTVLSTAKVAIVKGRQPLRGEHQLLLQLGEFVDRFKHQEACSEYFLFDNLQELGQLLRDNLSDELLESGPVS